MASYETRSESDVGFSSKQKKPFYYYLWDSFGKEPAGEKSTYVSHHAALLTASRTQAPPEAGLFPPHILDPWSDKSIYQSN